MNVVNFCLAHQKYVLADNYRGPPCQGRYCATCGRCRDWVYTGDPQAWQWIRNVRHWDKGDEDRWCNNHHYKNFELRDGATCNRSIYFSGGLFLRSLLPTTLFSGSGLIWHICVCE